MYNEAYSQMFSVSTDKQRNICKQSDLGKDPGHDLITAQRGMLFMAHKHKYITKSNHRL
jgi:hypothetical protein